jgi:hypothetical protein
VNLWIAFSPGRLHPLTARLGRENGARFEAMRGLEGYPDFLAERWRIEQDGWVNWEHDVVPWPGAVADLMTCPEPWCGFTYEPWQRVGEGASAYLGLTKFSPAFLAATQGVFEPGPHWTAERPRNWMHCDGHLWMSTELPFHQHWPCVVNAREAA